jgi:Family of unknown function (DUF6174)
MRFFRALQCLLTACLVLPGSACKETSAGTLLEQQQQRWQERQPDRYVAQICETPYGTECRRIAVENGAVVAAQIGSVLTRWESAGDVSEWDEPIESLFEAARERRSECILKQLEFDGEYGYVGEYMYQCRDPADDHGEEVVCFVEGADSLEACNELHNF